MAYPTACRSRRSIGSTDGEGCKVSWLVERRPGRRRPDRGGGPRRAVARGGAPVAHAFDTTSESIAATTVQNPPVVLVGAYRPEKAAPTARSGRSRRTASRTTPSGSTSGRWTPSRRPPWSAPSSVTRRHRGRSSRVPGRATGRPPRLLRRRGSRGVERPACGGVLRWGRPSERESSSIMTANRTVETRLALGKETYM